MKANNPRNAHLGFKFNEPYMPEIYNRQPEGRFFIVGIGFIILGVAGLIVTFLINILW